MEKIEIKQNLAETKIYLKIVYFFNHYFKQIHVCNSNVTLRDE